MVCQDYTIRNTDSFKDLQEIMERGQKKKDLGVGGQSRIVVTSNMHQFCFERQSNCIVMIPLMYFLFYFYNE